MTLEMRELKGNDMFKMLNIVGKLNIKDDFIKLIDGQENQDNNTLGVAMMASLLQTTMLNLDKVKDDLNSFLADLTGKTTEEITDLSFTDYTELIKAFFKKPELADFFKSFASFVK